MNNKEHHPYFQHMPHASALCEIILDSKGEPNDYRFTEVNPAFKKYTGLSDKEIIGKTGKEIFPNTRQLLIDKYGKTVKTQHSIFFTDYIPNTKNNCSIESFSISKGNFSMIFSDINENNQSELTESEEKRRIWLENSPACTKIVDLDLNLQYMSKAGSKGLQVKDVSQYYGKPYPLSFYPKAFKTTMTSNLKKVIKTGKIITQEAPIFDLKGNEIWFHSTIVPVNDSKGKLDYLMVVSIDTTEKKKAENALIESEDRLHSFYSSSPTAINIYKLEKDNSLVLIDLNPKAEEVTGLSRASLVGKTIEKAFPNLVGTNLPKMYRDIVKGKLKTQNYIYNYEDKRFSGWYDVTVFKVGKDKVATEIIDITEKKNAQEVLKKNEEILNRTGKMAKIGGWELDLEKNKLFWTLQTYKIHEVNPSVEPDLKYGLNYYPPESRPIITAAVQAAVDHGTPYDLEIPFITEKGKRIWVRTKGSAIVKNGKTIKLQGTFQDVTEKKETEKKLIKLKEGLEIEVVKRTKDLVAAQEKILSSEKLSTIGKLAGVMAHEVRNPLGSISNSAYFLKVKLKDNPDKDITKHLNILQTEVINSNKIISDVLEFSKMKTPKLESNDINHFLEKNLLKLDVPKKD